MINTPPPLRLRMNNLRPPPRAVPLGVALTNLFGGFENFMGWFFFGFGMIFAWFAGYRADYSFITFTGAKGLADGRVVAIRETNASVGGGKHSQGTPVYEYRFTYTVNGAEFEGLSYRTGTSFGEGDRVQVEYLLRDPSRARIEGMRRNYFDPWILFVLIFPAVGIGFIQAGFRRGLRANRLLAWGRITHGRFVSMEATGGKINNQVIYKLFFDCTAADGRRHTAIARTHLVERLQDEEQEPLLYDPRAPERAVLVDELPGAPGIDARGQLVTASYWNLLKALALPAATLFGHGLTAACLWLPR